MVYKRQLDFKHSYPSGCDTSKLLSDDLKNKLYYDGFQKMLYHYSHQRKAPKSVSFWVLSFCCTAAFTAPPYRYAPFASRYSIRHSSTLPPCFQAAKPVPGLPAVRPWLYCRCPPHQGADQGLCSGSAGRRWPCAACRPRRSRCVHGRWSRRAVSAAAGSVSTSLQTSRRLGRMPISGAPATGCARNTVYSW